MILTSSAVLILTTILILNTYLDRVNNRVVKFTYLRYLEDDPRSVTYLVVTERSERSKIVVKIVDRYGVEVHNFLAAQHYAPRLHYYGPFPKEHIYSTLDNPFNANFEGISCRDTYGPVVATSTKMVVMDFINSSLEIWPSPFEARSQINYA
jgi:hypothetical protein